MRYGHSFAVLAIASVVLSGCGLIGEGTGSAGGQEEKVNMQEAADRAEQILDNTFAGIKPTVEATRGPSTEAICPDIKGDARSEEHTSELQSRENLVCRLLLEKKKN